ncbi:general transcription factor IIH subunit 2-like [Anneissia japonica]|uniref:general transcription factor IIH subunit 2-like n=1 Tax=Anneissia japonica TaxID=1529436 RepID=UPI0014257346|nr:general transcription factor IIH subunit 2-like [Anneissia japonica]
MDEEPEKAYTWEGDYERTWEAIKEDEQGSLQSTVDDIIHRAKRRRLLDRPVNVRLGMMRHLYIVLDMSKSMEMKDLKPTRLHSTIKLLESFIEEYFDQNPISQLGMLTTSNMRAEKLTELGGNPRRHINSLRKCIDKVCLKEPSIQNSLELALNSLRNLDKHAVQTSANIMTVGCGAIQMMKVMKANNIRCSVIGLAAEVRICKKLCNITNGTYGVILDEIHFKELLMEHTLPPPATVNSESSLIKMGFPKHQIHTDKPAICVCHLDSKSSEGFSLGGYFCPQCHSKYCELPVECKCCGLTLVSAPHLARSFHHLFPLDEFTEIAIDTVKESYSSCCKSCQGSLEGQAAYICPRCAKVFCLDCEVFIQEALHSCPGCASTRRKQKLNQLI